MIQTGVDDNDVIDDIPQPKKKKKPEPELLDAEKSKTSIYIRNIPYDVTEKELKQKFRRCGKIMSIR